MNLIYIQDPKSMQQIDLKRSQGQQMNQPNTGKRKVRGPNNIKKHQSKKNYSLRSKHYTKIATVSEISHSGERVRQTMNEERSLFYQNKTPSVFANPNDPNLTANGGYNNQADNEYGGNGYDHADSQSGRYGYDHQADNQYDGNGYDHADSQCRRYGYDHQTENQYNRYGYDHQANYQCSGHECNHRVGDHHGGCESDQADNEGYGVNRHIGSNQSHYFYGDRSYIYSKYFWGNHQNNTDTHQQKQNQFIGRGSMKVYDAGVIHCDYIPHNAWFTRMYCIIPLFR